MKLRTGIVGTNRISSNFRAAAEQVPGMEVCAVYSRKQETGEAFANAHQIPQVFTSYKEFLESDIDAVYVASPNYIHCAQALEAMEKKKHVLCEKVMAVSEKEAAEMAACAKRNQVILLEAMRPDFDPAWKLVEEHLPKIGTIRRATFEYCQYSGRYDKFRNGEIENAFNPELCNAAVMDIGVYCIHSLVRLFGMPREVKSCSTKLVNGFEGSGIVLMQYEDFLAEAVYSKISVSVNPSVIQGEDGSILLDHIGKTKHMELRLRRGSRDTLDGGEIHVLPYEPVDNNMIYEIEEFQRLIREREVEHKYLKYSLDTLRVIDEVRRQNSIVFPVDKVL